MAQEYTVSAVSSKPPREWEGKFGTMETYSVKLEEQGDVPVEVNRKPGNKPIVGDKLYGDIERTEYGDKFKAAKKPFTPNGGGFKGQPKDEAGIKAMWAIGQAVQVAISQPLVNNTLDMPAVEKLAKAFYAAVDRVKGSVPAPASKRSSESTSPKATGETQDSTAISQTGKQPARDWSNLGKISPEEADSMDDGDFANLIRQGIEESGF